MIYLAGMKVFIISHLPLGSSMTCVELHGAVLELGGMIRIQCFCENFQNYGIYFRKSKFTRKIALRNAPYSRNPMTLYNRYRRAAVDRMDTVEFNAVKLVSTVARLLNNSFLYWKISCVCRMPFLSECILRVLMFFLFAFFRLCSYITSNWFYLIPVVV